MTKDEFDSEIMTLLGGNLVDVELTPEDYDTAFKRAKKVFLQKGNNNYVETYISLPIKKDQTEYDLSTLGVEFQGISEVVQMDETFVSDNPFSQAILNDIMFGLTSFSGPDFITYELILNLKETLARYTIKEIPYTFNRFTRQMRLLGIPKRDTIWFLRAMTTPPDDQLRDILWIQEYAHAEALHILGMAYRKFQTLPSPTGESSLSGDSMIQDAKEMKEKLMDDIANYVDGEPTGGAIILG